MGKPIQPRRDWLGTLANTWALVDASAKAWTWFVASGTSVAALTTGLALWNNLNASAVFILAALGFGAGLFLRAGYVFVKAVDEQRQNQIEATESAERQVVVAPALVVNVAPSDVVTMRLLDDAKLERQRAEEMLRQKDAIERDYEALRATVRDLTAAADHDIEALRDAKAGASQIAHQMIERVEQVTADFDLVMQWYELATETIRTIDTATQSPSMRVLYTALTGRPGGQALPPEEQVKKIRALIADYNAKRVAMIRPQPYQIPLAIAPPSLPPTSPSEG